MYNKEDAGKALNNLRESYNFTQHEAEEHKKIISEFEQSKQDWQYIQEDRRKIGILATLILTANMLWGFANIIAFFVFAGLTLASLVGTIIDQIAITHNIKEHDKFLNQYQEELNEFKQDIKDLSCDIDVLQDVVHSSKELDESYDQIITEWKDVPPIEDKEWEM